MSDRDHDYFILHKDSATWSGPEYSNEKSPPSESMKANLEPPNCLYVTEVFYGFGCADFFFLPFLRGVEVPCPKIYIRNDVHIRSPSVHFTIHLIVITSSKLFV